MNLVLGELTSSLMMSGELKKEVVGVAGLADNTPFFDYLSSEFMVSKRWSFSDHHRFTENDIKEFLKISEDRTLLCTYKDAVKLQQWPEMATIAWGYVPIQVTFLKGEEEFLKKLKQTID